MKIKTIMVVGSGLMGGGIAQVAAQAGYNVIMNDVKMEFIDRGFNNIAGLLEKQVKKEKIAEADKNIILSRIEKGSRIRCGSKS